MPRQGLGGSGGGRVGRNTSRLRLRSDCWNACRPVSTGRTAWLHSGGDAMRRCCRPVPCFSITSFPCRPVPPSSLPLSSVLGGAASAVGGEGGAGTRRGGAGSEVKSSRCPLRTAFPVRACLSLPTNPRCGMVGREDARSDGVRCAAGAVARLTSRATLPLPPSPPFPSFFRPPPSLSSVFRWGGGRRGWSAQGRSSVRGGPDGTATSRAPRALKGGPLSSSIRNGG